MSLDYKREGVCHWLTEGQDMSLVDRRVGHVII